MNQRFSKAERLKSKKIIGRLYEEGTAIKVFPLRMVYLQVAHDSTYPIQAGVSVSKRHFKKAVDRNRIKRLLREAYRKKKQLVYDEVNFPYVFMITFIDRKAWKYVDIEKRLEKLLTSFIEQTRKSI